MTKHRRFRFKLRTTFFVVAFVAVLIAIPVNYAARSNAQRLNVRKLQELGGQYYSRDGESDKIRVWYDDDLQWNQELGRYEIVLNFGRESGFKDWIRNWLGRDFVHFPVALELDCHDGQDKTTFNDEMVKLIRHLPTVRQVWIGEWRNSDGELVNVFTNDDLRAVFPNLIIAGPQPRALVEGR